MGQLRGGLSPPPRTRAKKRAPACPLMVCHEPRHATSHGMPSSSLQPPWPTGLGRVPLGSPPPQTEEESMAWLQVRQRAGAQEKRRSFSGVHASPRAHVRGPPQPGARLLSVAACLRPPRPGNTTAALAGPGLSRRGARAGAAAGWRGERSPCRRRCTCRGSRPCAPSRARPGRPGP